MASEPFDEMYVQAGQPRPHCSELARWLEGLSSTRLQQKKAESTLLFHRLGITFALYGEAESTERLIPFDLVPRVIPASEWAALERGLRQRVTALNLFLHDIYHEQQILKDGVIPAAQVLSHPNFRPEMVGIHLPNQVYAHVAGVDLVRDEQGAWLVLEDNLRTPSGVSYMLANRQMMMRLFPQLFVSQQVRPVEHYPDLLLDTLRCSAPEGVKDPVIVVLTPGPFNSAYFEHAFLAQQMGVELVEGQDLFTRNDRVWMRTTAGPRQVDVIYRRLDDDFLDPLAFRPDSILGVPGLLAVVRKGKVALANAIGTGVADDKSIYIHVPAMIRYYLAEEPILSNVPTYQLGKPDDLAYVLEHLQDLVVKEVAGSGGYGMLVGPASDAAERAAYQARILAAPDQFIAQPTLCLSTCPTYVEQGLAPRHIDLRPFVLSGRGSMTVPGGLTRVALKEGSLVVNSSQGGGTKDTWVVEDQPC